jgi:CDP-glycerol glycerophosphotransferase
MLRGMIHEPVMFLFKGIFMPFLGWLFIIPLTFIIPKKKNRIIFWGRDKGEFTDNVKYLFLHILSKHRNDFEAYFLTENSKVFDDLRYNKLPVLLYPGFKTAFKLLRSGIIVTDSDIWINNFRYHLLFRSYKVQLWHGVGLKKIGLDNSRVQRTMNHWIMRLYYFLKGRFVEYDLLISTSEMFTLRGYTTGLRKKQVINSGYPRNDVFFDCADCKIYLGTDRDAVLKIREFKENGYRIIVYLPTFRDSKKDAVTSRVLDVSAIDEFCKSNKILFIFKFHSWGILKDPILKKQLEQADNVMVYDNSGDIYPVLKEVDIMVSDYSSVYMDYLLLNKPIIFFTYDLEEYERLEREFYYEYDQLTPGEKCKNQKELLFEISEILNSAKDDFKKERVELSKKTFKYNDGRSSERIADYLREVVKTRS